MNKIKEFFEDILNELRDISYKNSPERAEFAAIRIQHHKEYMENKRRWSPYLHPDEWDQES